MGHSVSIRRLVSAVVATVLAAALFPQFARAQTTNDAQANGVSDQPSISGDGRYVAFRSSASNLVPNDTNGVTDIFVRDRQNAVTILVSVARGGGAANSFSSAPSMSPDGRYVVFESDATNLVATDTNGSVDDIFLRDLQTGSTSIASLGSAGQQGDKSAAAPAITRDGRYVVWSSGSTNYVTKANGTSSDIFIRDRVGGQTERVSVSDSEAEANSYSRWPTVSTDGRFVAFRSTASNLVVGDTNGRPDIFVRDRTSQSTFRVSVTSDELQGTQESESNTWISENGRYVAFPTDSNLTAQDTNLGWDVYRRDTTAGTTALSSGSSSGGASNGHSDWGSISGDGSRVAFWSTASNLISGDTNGVNDVFVRNHSAATTIRASVSSSGAQANGMSDFAQVSAGAGHVVFQSDATNLISEDTNEVKDIFVRELVSGTTSRASLTSGNHAPVVQFSVTPEQGDTSTTFTATLAGSYDPDGDALTYSIDWGDGAVTMASTGTHRYEAVGEYTVVGTVTDSFGVASSANRTIRVCTASGQICSMNPAPSEPLESIIDENGATHVEIAGVATPRYDDVLDDWEPPPSSGLVPACDSTERDLPRVLPIYAYPNETVPADAGTEISLLVKDIQWMNDEFDRAAGPSRDQNILWKMEGMDVSVCPVSIERANDAGAATKQQILDDVQAEAHVSSSRVYLIWYDGQILDEPDKICSAGCVDDNNPATDPSYIFSPLPSATTHSAALHEFIHALGKDGHSCEFSDHMYQWWEGVCHAGADDNRSEWDSLREHPPAEDLCGYSQVDTTNTGTIDCNKNDHYSSLCAITGCELRDREARVLYNIATSEFLQRPMTHPFSATCDGRSATFGDEDFDSFLGTSNADVYQGWEGNDTLGGSMGSDVMCGHWGIDIIRGEADADRLFGGWGNDTLRGGAGEDYVSGRYGADFLYDGLGKDTIVGGPGHDILFSCADGVTETKIEGVEETRGASAGSC